MGLATVPAVAAGREVLRGLPGWFYCSHMSDVPHPPTGGIALCPSTPHRAVLGLVRAALGRPVGPALVDDLRASDPQQIVQIATYAYVHVAVATAFDHAPELGDAVPEDLVIYFREMQAANRRRNAEILGQLGSVGAVLAAEGVEGVVLKGGAELLDPVFPDPAARFLSDLDILVPEADIGRAVARLGETGAVSSEISDIDAPDHHHVAPLGHPDWPVPVELHRRLGQGRWRDLLAADAVVAAARPSGVPGLALPSARHRLAHAVQHAQLQPPRYRDGLLSLRDMMELEVMRAVIDPRDVAAARALFDAEGQAAWDALDAACALAFADAERIAGLSPAARRWAEAAIAGFGRPGRRRLASLGRWAGWYLAEFIRNPERRRHYLRQLSRPGRIRRVLSGHLDRLRRTR